ncbi:sugar efflux transporter [Deinococcus hopiensis]|uniref:MFS transporter, SET family, sugar efflux transporter n=1 Tax=Deinococcus hopiensis KR-140 TaxID=695939 RepID=A0A1W1V5Q8_9DEIO|nr:sugar efflux transporter [Deinococcus hopiensis]SMB88646.1 MFS transporter, SET family, sugar efflux transporter [Deinococcus hopiensis KR-140]
MHTNPLLSLKNVPGYLGMAVTVLLLGFATSFAMPYMSLFGVQKVGMSPLLLGVYLTVVALSSITISTLLARWSDRLPDRRPVVLTAIAAGTLGFVLLAFTTNYLAVLLIAAVCLGTGSAAFPQVFALSRAQAGAAGEQGMTALRSVFSLAWVVGPGIGAALLAGLHFPGLFLATAACYVGAAIPVLRRMRAPLPPATTSGEEVQASAPATPPRPMHWVALSFVLYGTAMNMGSAALPIHVTRGLHGSEGNVGFLVGLCALLEIPIMLSFVLRARRASNEKLILWGMMLFALYYVMVFVAPNIAWLAVAQAVRAVVVAILATLGMAYVQELMPDRVGVATTLYSNTMNAGSLLGGLGLGVCAGLFGYHAVFVLAGVLSLAAWGLLLATRRGLGARGTAEMVGVRAGD